MKNKIYIDKLLKKEQNQKNKLKSMLNKNYQNNINHKENHYYKEQNFKNKKNWKKKFIDKKLKKKLKNNLEFKPFKEQKNKWMKDKLVDTK